MYVVHYMLLIYILDLQGLNTMDILVFVTGILHYYFTYVFQEKGLVTRILYGLGVNN